MDEGRPISYLALSVGTAVLSSSGEEFGTVERVLQVPELDVFDGITVKTRFFGLRFVDRDQITDITTTLVRTTIEDTATASLPPPKGTLVIEPDIARDEGTSLRARIARFFGRSHYKNVD